MTTLEETLREMSISEFRQVESRIIVIIEHLLKIRYVSGQLGEQNLRGWQRSVKEQQRKLADHIRVNPGLKSKISSAVIESSYKSAVTIAARGFTDIRFPESRDLTFEEILGQDAVSQLNR